MRHILIIGLGNPGEQFKDTRHNLGQDVVGRWIDDIRQKDADIQDMQSKESLHARIQEIVLNDVKITILFPDVFMNESGKAVAQYLRYNEINKKNILVIHDDLELALGDVKYQEAGSAHGHNGMRSIHQYVGDTDIPQLRIGIGRPIDQRPIEKFVLEKFKPEERAILQEKRQVILDAITKVIEPRRNQE